MATIETRAVHLFPAASPFVMLVQRKLLVASKVSCEQCACARRPSVLGDACFGLLGAAVRARVFVRAVPQAARCPNLSLRRGERQTSRLKVSEFARLLLLCHNREELLPAA